MKLHKQAYTVYKTQYHIVWVTRFCRKWLVQGINSYFRIKLEEVREFYPDWYFTEIGIDKDHVHLHMIIPSKYSVSMAVETMKKEYQPVIARKIPALLRKGLPEQRWNLVKGVLCLNRRYQRRNYQEIRPDAGRGRCRTSVACIILGTTGVNPWCSIKTAKEPVKISARTAF